MPSTALGTRGPLGCDGSWAWLELVVLVLSLSSPYLTHVWRQLPGPQPCSRPPFGQRKVAEPPLPRRGPVAVSGPGTRCDAWLLTGLLKATARLLEARTTFSSVDQRASVCRVLLGQLWPLCWTQSEHRRLQEKGTGTWPRA